MLWSANAALLKPGIVHAASTMRGAARTAAGIDRAQRRDSLMVTILYGFQRRAESSGSADRAQRTYIALLRAEPEHSRDLRERGEIHVVTGRAGGIRHSLLLLTARRDDGYARG